MTRCTDWIGLRSQRLTAAQTASSRITSPYCAARQRLPTAQRSPMGRGKRWHMCWTGCRIGCRTIAVTWTRDWWCSRAGRSRSTHPKMSPISARPRCGDCCAPHSPRTSGKSCWPTSTTGRTPISRLPKRRAVTNRNSRSAMACALPRGWCAPPPSESGAQNLSRRVPGDSPPSATARWTRGTLSCARGPNPSGPWSSAKCVSACGAPA